jgi:hypothetical protein
MVPALTSAVDASECSHVTFNFTGVPTGPFVVEGVVTGDLEGRATFTFDPSSVELKGKKISNSGTARWTITGGVFSNLTFTTAFENKNVPVEPPDSPMYFKNTGKHEELSGVREAKLHYEGTFTFVPSALVNHDYKGKICP